jgi:hypothetical protein
MNHSPDGQQSPLSVKDFIERLDERLKSAGASYAEQAFGIGCSLSLVPLGLLLLISFLLGARNGISLGLVAIIGILTAIALASWAASRARLGAIQQTFQRTILPEINTYLQSQGLEMDEFSTLVVEQMPEESLLRQQMAQQIRPDLSLQEEQE